MSWGEVKTMLNTIQGGKQEFTANGTFTVPNFVKQIFITAVGGGGAGGHGGSYNSDGSTKTGGGGGGGASGETIIKKCIEVSPGDTVTIVIGLGGIAASSVVPGGATTITHGNTVLTANGGAGGAKGSYGNATGGTGGQGQNGGRSGFVGNGQYGGAGGGTVIRPTDDTDYPTILGGAGSADVSQPGNAGTKGSGGGGGAGGTSRHSATAGGNGGDGYVLIEWGLAAIGN